MITQTQLINKYGTPNEEGRGYIIQIVLPYPMYYDNKKVTKIRCHKLVADKLRLRRMF